jgi:hypothetical protein
MISFNPNIWGPKSWFFLDTIILSYPNNPSKNDKLLFSNFFINICNVLPCKKCCIHYKKHLEHFPLNDDILSSKKKLILWWINIHNEVNKSNNKKQFLNINNFIQYYNEYYNINISMSDLENNHTETTTIKLNQLLITKQLIILLIYIIIIILIYYILY